MASSRRLPLSYNTSTYNKPGGGATDYSTLQGWEEATDINLVTATAGEVLESYKGAHADNDTLDGATCDADYFRVVKPASGEGHSGIPLSDSSCVEFHSTASGNSVWGINETYSQWQDCVLTLATNSSTNTYCFDLNGDQSAAIGLLVYNVSNAGSGNCNGISTRAATPKVFYIIDCLAHNCKSIGFFQGWTGTGYFYNCTSTNNTARGFSRTSGTGIAINCTASSNGASDWAGTWTQTTCTAEGANPTYVDAANDDFHLAEGDTVCRGNGTDLSGDAAYAFDDDIDGDTRSAWDIGFDEYVVGGPSAYSYVASGAMTPAGAFGRKLMANRTYQGVLTFSGLASGIRGLIQRTVDGAIDLAGAFSRKLRAPRAVDGTVSFTGVPTGVRGLIIRAVDGVLSLLGAFNRKLMANRPDDGSFTPSGTVGRKFKRKVTLQSNL